MFDSYKERLRLAENELAYNSGMQAENLCLTQLLKLFGDAFFMPLTTWSIAPSEVVHILNDILIHNRKSVIEFGSGFSTVCIAQLIKNNGLDCPFYSIENNRDWHASMKATLKRYELTEFVQLVLAEVDEVDDKYAKQANSKWYSVNTLNSALGTELFDLVIVDGPFGSISPYARYPAIPFLMEKRLADGFAIFLDDSNRPHEAQIIGDWGDMLKANVKNFERYAYITQHKGFDSEPFAFKKF